MNYDSHDRFKKGSVVMDMDDNPGRVLGRNTDAEDSYTHWIVQWDVPVHDEFGNPVYLVTSTRSVELK